MFLNICPFCEHGNPTDSKFCNACGGALHLVPCPRCGAVSDVTAASCYQCRGQLAGHGAEAIDLAEPAVEATKPLPRPHFRVIVGTAILAAITVLVYFSYRQRSPVDALQPLAASGEASGHGGTASASVIPRDAVAGNRASAKADNRAGPAKPATGLPETPLAGPTPAEAKHPRAEREPVKSREAKVVAAPIARTKAINEGRVSKPGLPRPEACTESVAALGLCTFKPAERKEAEKLATNKAEIARPQSAAAGKAGGQDLRQGETCTTAVAALGLCTPRLTREGK